MRNAILFIIFLIFSFFINVVFYYISDDYRQFLKEIKTDSSISNIDNSLISPSKNNTPIKSNDFNNQDSNIDDSFEIVKPSNENDVIFNKIDDKVQIKSSINL